jgi:hypothetical protein
MVAVCPSYIWDARFLNVNPGKQSPVRTEHSGSGSSVGIATDYGRAGRSGDRIPDGARFFAHVQTGPVTHPASCTMGTGSFPGAKRPERDADHPPPHSAEFETEQNYTSTPPLGPWWYFIG